MARVLFTNPTNLFGVNFANRDIKLNNKMQRFHGPVEVQSLFKCPSSGNIDFIHDGFKFESISPNLLEIIN